MQHSRGTIPKIVVTAATNAEHTGININSGKITPNIFLYEFLY